MKSDKFPQINNVQQKGHFLVPPHFFRSQKHESDLLVGVALYDFEIVLGVKKEASILLMMLASKLQKQECTSFTFRG